MNNFIVGIDVGSSKVCGSIGKIDKHGKLQILGVTSISCLGMKKASLIDVENVSEAINNCVKQLENMVDFKINHTFISIPASICDLVYNKGVIYISVEDNKIKETDVKRVLEAAQLISIHPNKEIIGIVPIKYIIDGDNKVKDPIGINCERLEVEAQIIISDTNVITNLFKSFNKANVKIEGLVLQPLGAATVLFEEKEMENGVALVDIGYDTTTVSVFKDNYLCFIETFPLGGNSITNDISMVFKISTEESERIKIKYANVTRISNDSEESIKVSSELEGSFEVKYSMLFEVIEARVEEILSFVYKSLQKSGFYNEISDLVLSGGGISSINGITEISKEIIGKNIKIGSLRYTGLSSSVYSNSIGILKYVSNKTKYNDLETDLKKPVEDKLVDNLNMQDKRKPGILLKIKNLIEDFFK